MKIRDFIATPFVFLGLFGLHAAVTIGGKWTAERILDVMGRSKKETD